MTALYGAFSLAEMYYVSEIIAKYLELDVVRILYVLLDVQSSSSFLMTLMPLPPPPAEALMMTG